jgi:hypothetical protein
LRSAQSKSSKHPSAQRGKHITICKEIVFNGGRSMTKEELQAKHRLEEAQARNRQKERKARTRRLIQEGAILENIMPEIKNMDPEAIKNFLLQRLYFGNRQP